MNYDCGDPGCRMCVGNRLVRNIPSVRDTYNLQYVDWALDVSIYDSPSYLKLKYDVLFDHGFNNSSNNKPMKVTSMVRRLLDKDAQTLVKAGFFNGDLELTDEGKKALFAIMLDANKAALVVEAQEVIDEKDKK